MNTCKNERMIEMNTQEVSLLAIQRHKTLALLRTSKLKYAETLSSEHHEQMLTIQGIYQRFYALIYTHLNVLEMIELLKESADAKIILDELDGYLVSLEMNRDGLPMLTVKAIKTDA